MAKIEVDLVNRVWARDPEGELVRFTVTRRSNMTMEAIVEKAEAEEVMKALWRILNPVQFAHYDGQTIAYQPAIGGGYVVDLESFHPGEPV